MGQAPRRTDADWFPPVCVGRGGRRHVGIQTQSAFSPWGGEGGGVEHVGA